jgi:hypothetical protein
MEAVMSLVKRFMPDTWLFVVGIIAAAVRCVRPGLALVIWDEINLLFWSSRIAHYGDWIWLSNNWVAWEVDWNPITHHSPLNNYLLAIPYLVTTDPIFVRLVVQLMGAVSVIVLYVLVKRYFGIHAAVISSLTLALLPFGVDNVRHISNPNLAPLFIALNLLTGLLGYHENKRWGQIMHWVFLGIAAQNHPTNVLLALPSLVVLAHNLRFQRGNRRAVITQTAIGILITAATYVPWMLGIFGGEAFQTGIMGVSGVNTAPESARVLVLPDIAAQISRIASGTSFDMTHRGTSLTALANWWPPSELDSVLWIHTGAVLIGCMIVLIYALQKPKDRLPHLFIVLTVILPLIAANLVSPGAIQDFYLLSIQFGTAAIWGIILAWVYRWKPLGRILAFAAASIVLILFTWLNVGKLYWLDHYGWEQKLRAPMETLIDQTNRWSQQANDIVFLVDAFDEKYSTVDSQRYFWTVIGQHIPIRVIDRMSGEGVPISPQGTLLVSFADGQTIPTYFGGGTTTGATSQVPDQPIFLMTMVYPTLPQQWDFSPESIDQFDNGARILGIDAFDAQADAGSVFFNLYWVPTQGVPAANYQFSVRLMAEDGRTIGQQDIPSLSRDLWQAGDTVISPFHIQISASVDSVQPLRVQILMYTYPDMDNANAVDDAGNPVGQWLFLTSTSNGG